jgi:LmbE family N-acetylglucosaminyl deacetylase
VPIGEVHDQKRQALEAHETQMHGLEGVEDCPTLADVAGGEFLERFFASYEIFMRYRKPPPPPNHPS